MFLLEAQHSVFMVRPKKVQTVIVPSFCFVYLNTGEFVYDAENSGAGFDGLRGDGCKWT